MPPKKKGKKEEIVEYEEDGITPKLSKAELKEQFMVEFLTQVKMNYELLYRPICPQWRAERKKKVWLELLKFANDDIKVKGMFLFFSHFLISLLKFIYSEKAINFAKSSPYF